MTPSPRLARAAAKVLSQPAAEEHHVSAKSRAAATAAIRQALAAKASRKRRLRWLVPAVAAGLIATTIGAAMLRGRSTPEVATTVAPTVVPQGLVARSMTGEIVVLRGGSRVPLREGERVAFGERIRAEGKGTLVFTTGTRLDLEPASELVVDDRDGSQVVQLDAGALTASVAKLAVDRRFIVRTAEADVEVRGTVFRVTRSVVPGCGPTTTVRVAEGRVVARSAGQEQPLLPGEGWASVCAASNPPNVTSPPPAAPAAPSSASPSGIAPALRAAPITTGVATGTARPQAAPPPEPKVEPERTSASDLAKQNTLFADAMAAKGRGDASAAVGLLEDLVARYPRAPLREAALAERMKLLARSDRERAATAAREYLSAYPNGFARSDAEAIARGAP